MRDPHFGHRNFFTNEVEATAEEWIHWDFILATAVQIIEDNTNQHGLLHWEVENERMDVIAEKRIDKFQAAVDRATKGTKKKGYTKSDGETWTPKLDLRGGEWPTYSDYLKSLQEEAEKAPDGTIE